jgi:ribosome maturation factor RimP
MFNTSGLEKIQQIAEDIITSMGLEFVELEYKQEGRQMVLRLYINKEGGISLDDCTSVSKELSAVLDVEDLLPAKFTLEVSSPGLNRPLKTVADYEKNVGKLIKVKTFEALPDNAGNKRKTFLGNLESFSGNIVTIQLKEGQKAEIPLDKVSRANLEFEF